MRSRVDVWPSLTDLFSALLVATFGGLMMIAERKDAGDGAVVSPLCVDVVAREIRDKVVTSLKQPLQGEVRRDESDDAYLDVYLNFELNKDEIRLEDQEKLQRACMALARLLRDQPRLKEEVEIWIEGHTDASPPRDAATERDRELFNWRLSSNRAASVLYEFSRCGVKPETHRIRAVGYAHTEPLPQCVGKQVCPENRRTTFRIRPDKAKIAERPELCRRRDCTPPPGCSSGPPAGFRK
jgi:outer membrane protein OmpA-like peptidoglycan-associated protein